MSVQLTKLQKRLCNALQEGLPICRRPYEDLAEFLGSDEKTVLQETGKLKEAGVIRRICAVINYRALGMTGTLVAAHIPQESLEAVAEAVNGLGNVSHNYLRKHYYNLWFTLQAESPEQIEATVSDLSGQFGIGFYRLPAERVFKLDVRFDTEDEGRFSDIGQIPKCKKVKLNEAEKQILSRLESDLEVISEPFDFLCSKELEIEEVLRIIQELIDKGVIRRIAAVVNNRKLGFIANALFVSEVPKDRIAETAQVLARLRVVSHCYERKPVKDWPYNLYAMIHGRTMGEIQRAINRLAEAERIDSFELLPTEAELKKESVKHRFD